MYAAAVHEGKTSIEERIAPRVMDRWLEHGPEQLWIDLLKPTTDDLTFIQDRFKLHPLAIEECDHTGVRPKIEQFEDHLYLVLHGVNHNEGEEQLNTVEFKVFLRQDLLITVHDKASSSIRATQQRLYQDRQLMCRKGVDSILHHIVDAIVDHYFPILEALEAQVEKLEVDIFHNPSDNLLEEMLLLQRQCLTLHRIIHPQLDILGALASGRFKEIGAADVAYFRDVYDHLQRISDRIQVAREMLVGSMQCCLSYASNRTNAVMKGLAVLATVMLPVTLLTSLLGIMNPEHLPGQGSPGTFWLVIAISISISIMLIAALKRLRWL